MVNWWWHKWSTINTDLIIINYHFVNPAGNTDSHTNICLHVVSTMELRTSESPISYRTHLAKISEVTLPPLLKRASGPSFGKSSCTVEVLTTTPVGHCRPVKAMKDATVMCDQVGEVLTSDARAPWWRATTPRAMESLRCDKPFSSVVKSLSGSTKMPSSFLPRRRRYDNGNDLPHSRHNFSMPMQNASSRKH